MQTLPRADILFEDGRTPRDRASGDVYFDAVNGADESRHVFLRGNQLPQRWADMARVGRSPVIAEIGHGTGLNLLVAMQAWQIFRQGAAR